MQRRNKRVRELLYIGTLAETMKTGGLQEIFGKRITKLRRTDDLPQLECGKRSGADDIKQSSAPLF